MELILLKIWAFVQSACKFNYFCGSTGGFANTKAKKKAGNIHIKYHCCARV